MTARFLAAFLIALFPFRLAAQEISVGVIASPPFANEARNGLHDGLAIDLFRLTAEAAGLSYRFTSLAPGSDPAAALVGHDIVLPVEADAKLEERVDISHPFYTATLGIAAPEQPKIFKVLRGFLTLDFLRVILSLSVVLLAVGAIVWLAERRRNAEMFHRDAKRGLGDGFWWAGVTLTTIGYGDKAPRTFLGRTVAMLWMLVGLAVSAALTAAVVTLAGGEGKSGDLPEAVIGKRVAVPADGTAEAFLAGRGVISTVVPDAAAALTAVAQGEADAAVASAPALSFANERGGHGLNITTTRWDPVLIAMAFREADPLGERLNTTLLQVLASEAGQEVVRRWLPDEY
ncbi:Bacterial extracellular solute-binding proteins, family 3 [Jannaschia seosinensis]|uniref:Bacterial extracellular solute-binding proteins, family 3 n=1 Tax=Jannaschia seosinensis TaxID=313367 RepID=A0A0M7B7D9_9RHOB|nr:transporter substrate-binding domain-containing protein [Jannaschia seosinensis]CUH18441.1 Bacterial extracellular solute-binding proteins, family 3 [Jannaschia seosinensis]